MDKIYSLIVALSPPSRKTEAAPIASTYMEFGNIIAEIVFNTVQVKLILYAHLKKFPSSDVTPIFTVFHMSNILITSFKQCVYEVLFIIFIAVINTQKAIINLSYQPILYSFLCSRYIAINN